jgi:murein DD-endopeptidase MepM/ murein hydrolase activator NlpD
LGRLRPRAAPLFFLVAAALAFSSCSFFKSSPPQPLRTGPGIYHVVKRGENLFRIGKAYDFTYQELARINRIEDVNQLQVGQKVFIPGATRQLPVEIITPSTVSLKRSLPSTSPEKNSAGLIWPVSGSMSSGFGRRGESFHDGIDILAPEGSPVRAVKDGEVVYSDQLRGYGNIVIVRHDGNLASVYAHNEKNRVREGQTVTQGETIAEVGSTGRASAPHLHFEIRRDNVAEDPLNYLPQ